MVGASAYVPQRGDVVWLTFTPLAGHEEAGRRPAAVLSPSAYNGKVGLALMCPVTSQIKGYPFEVLLPPGLAVSGAILADQVKSLDWQARTAEFICALPSSSVSEVLQKIGVLLSEWAGYSRGFSRGPRPTCKTTPTTSSGLRPSPRMASAWTRSSGFRSSRPPGD